MVRKCRKRIITPTSIRTHHKKNQLKGKAIKTKLNRKKNITALESQPRRKKTTMSNGKTNNLITNENIVSENQYLKSSSKWSKQKEQITNKTQTKDFKKQMQPSSGGNDNKVCKEVEYALKSFKFLEKNRFLTKRDKKQKEEFCQCPLSKDLPAGRLGCTECLNKYSQIECGPNCPSGNLCTNRNFQKKEYIECKVIMTKNKGLGVVAPCFIKSGTYIMEFIGEVKDIRNVNRMKQNTKHLYCYCLKYEKDKVIDATIKGNISRFINHSCDPNSEFQKWTVLGELRIGIFSIKNIIKNEEITVNYSYDETRTTIMECNCESVNCKGWL